MLSWEDLEESDDEVYDRALKTGKWWNRERVVRADARTPTVERDGGARVQWAFGEKSAKAAVVRVYRNAAKRKE